jgi:hypothetical protein
VGRRRAGVLIVLPNLLWQVDNGWPTREFAEEATGEKNAQGAALDLILLQLIVLLPLTAPVWLAGLWWLLFGREGRQYRMIALLWVVPFLIFLCRAAAVPTI